MTVCLPGTAKLSAGIGRTLSLKKVQIGSVGFTRREGIPEQWALYHTQEEIQEVNASDQRKRLLRRRAQVGRGRAEREREGCPGRSLDPSGLQSCCYFKIGDFPPLCMGVGGSKSIRIFSSP